ncbi:hypothetical protein GSI_10638 [Ganoderma sinense ZZ0214-1]|uniref:Uncharacterized protein n=1 Tax=Ganoderma sinense ZZ0214-1 TaxID=1077348 RepID=A0A2G8S170_9APHY|nr:hypothetical protein GSI_10638 [Ganoderma sinense ZZ0214-1]
MNSSRSEFGVRLPNDRLLESLRCREVEYGGDSRTPYCIDVDERRELTLLERRDDIEARLPRFEVLPRPPPKALPRPAERPLTVPLPLCRCDTGLEPVLFIEELWVSARRVVGSSLRFPLGSSRNHRWNVESRLARLRCPETLLPRAGICGSDVSVSAGDPVSGGGDCFPARIQGEPTCP